MNTYQSAIIEMKCETMLERYKQVRSSKEMRPTMTIHRAMTRAGRGRLGLGRALCPFGIVGMDLAKKHTMSVEMPRRLRWSYIHIATALLDVRRQLGGGLTHLGMLSQILRTLEGLGAATAAIGLEGDMDPDVRGDMIALLGLHIAARPSTAQVQVLLDLSPDMIIADVGLSNPVSPLLLQPSQGK